MAKKRITRNLVQVLDGIIQPVYFIDADWLIRYCNRACLEWLACDKDTLLDRRCVFQSGADLDAGDAIAAGLCPPPGAMESQESVGVVVCLDRTGQIARRRARFITLRRKDGPVGILGILDPQDLPRNLTAEEAASLAANVQAAVGADERVALELHEKLREFCQSRFSKGGMPLLVGKSVALWRLWEQIEIASRVTSNVTIWEPPGGGASRVARAIFYGGQPHPSQCLVPLPCQELDPDILRAVLQAFGETASGEYLHTVILEGVDLLPLPTQEALYEIVATPKRRFRLIATSERPLEELVNRGLLVAELAHLLSPFLLAIPSLRERRQDLPLIAQALLEEQNTKGTKQVLGFAREVLDLFTQYDWPRNFEECVLVVSYAHQQATGTLVVKRDLPQEFRFTVGRRLRAVREPDVISLPQYLAQVEKELLGRAMQRARGNKTQAAKLLGLSRARLYRRLVQYNLISEEEPEEEQE